MRCWRIGRHGLLLGGVGIVVVAVVVAVAEDGPVGAAGRRGHSSPRGRICRQEVAYSRSERVFVDLHGRRSEESEERQTVAAFRMRPSAASAPSLTSPASTPSFSGLSACSLSSCNCSPGHFEFACSIASLVSCPSTASRKSTLVFPHKAHPSCLRTTPPASASANSRPLPRPGLSGPNGTPGPESKLSSLSLSGAMQYLDPKVRQTVG